MRRWECSWWKRRWGRNRKGMFFYRFFWMGSWRWEVIRCLPYRWSFMKCFCNHFTWQYREVVFHCSWVSFYRILEWEAFSQFVHYHSLPPNAMASFHKWNPGNRFRRPMIAERCTHFTDHYNMPNEEQCCLYCQWRQFWDLCSGSRTIC